MPRTVGAKNKSKFAYVKLSQLCEFLNPVTMVPVKIDFLEVLKGGNNQFDFTETSNPDINHDKSHSTEEKEVIEVKILQPE